MEWFAEVPPREWKRVVREDRGCAEVLFRAWVGRELDRWSDRDPLLWDRAIGSWFVEAGFTCDLERLADDVRRWCWAEGWCLLSQDEDLLLMEDAYAGPLLEEAAAGCPKRAYALAIVEHHVRDSVHAALWARAGSPGDVGVERAVATALDHADRLLPRARATGHAALVEYLERLVSYGERRPVDVDEAEQRVLDVRRCSPHPDEPVVLVRRGRQWVAELDWVSLRPAELHIEAGTGRMYGVPGAKGPGSRRRRRAG